MTEFLFLMFFQKELLMTGRKIKVGNMHLMVVFGMKANICF